VALMGRAGLDVSAATMTGLSCFSLSALDYTGCATPPTGQRQIILGVGWILALGGVGYWIAPAVGPSIYRHGADSNATLIQNYMWQKHSSCQFSAFRIAQFRGTNARGSHNFRTLVEDSWRGPARASRRR
jgi:hypothetical protein